jgi:hypothetical protein
MRSGCSPRASDCSFSPRPPASPVARLEAECLASGLLHWHLQKVEGLVPAEREATVAAQPCRTPSQSDPPPAMRDLDIRRALHRELADAHAHEIRTTRIIDELAVCHGNARVDVAVINGSLSGYEIKSERDTLARLPSQAEHYGQVFDYMTIVGSRRHLDAIRSTVPRWWGLTAAERGPDGEVALRALRQPKRNRNTVAHAVCQLLWRAEALRILESLGADRGMANKSRAELWERLATTAPRADLADLVRDALRARGDWRSARPSVRRGGWSRRPASPAVGPGLSFVPRTR